MAWLFIWINFEYPSPKDALCQVWLKLAQWFWRRRWKCEKFTTTTDNGQISIRKAHFTLLITFLMCDVMFTKYKHCLFVIIRLNSIQVLSSMQMWFLEYALLALVNIINYGENSSYSFQPWPKLGRIVHFGHGLWWWHFIQLTSLQVKCWLGPASCGLCCRCLPQINESTGTRFMYTLFLVIGFVVASLMLSPQLEQTFIDNVSIMFLCLVLFTATCITNTFTILCHTFF